MAVGAKGCEGVNVVAMPLSSRRITPVMHLEAIRGVTQAAPEAIALQGFRPKSPPCGR